MSQNKRLRLFLLTLALCAFSIGFAAPNTPLKMKAPPQASGDGSVFGEVMPTELEQQVVVKPSWQPLSKQLAALQDATDVPLARAPSVPDDPLLVAAPGRTEFSLLRQMRLLLTDDQWKCRWANKSLGKNHYAYRLWREAVSPQERRAKMAQAAKDRLAKLLALIQAGPSAWNQMRQEDPALSNDIRQPINQAPLLLASDLSPDQLSSVLAGNPLTLDVMTMSPQDQILVRQSISASMNGNPVVTDTDNATGKTKTIFDAHHLPTTGCVIFAAKPLGDDPGSLGLAMHVYTEPERGWALGSNEMLYPDSSEFGDEAKQVEAQHRREATDALMAKTPGAKTVTIDKTAQPRPGEPQLAAYLRAFAEQTKLTVLAHWPPGSKTLTDDKGKPKRLPASIVNKPAGEALDLLCKTYGGEWVQDEATVRLRALPEKQPTTKVPAAAPPSVPAPPSSLPEKAP